MSNIQQDAQDAQEETSALDIFLEEKEEKSEKKDTVFVGYVFKDTYYETLCKSVNLPSSASRVDVAERLYACAFKYLASKGKIEEAEAVKMLSNRKK